MKRILEYILSLSPVLLLSTSLFALDYGHRLGERGGEFRPMGVSILSDALDPSVRKWYVPQEMFAEYQWRQWTSTNYAKIPYRRYVDTDLEGEYFYDLFGNLTTRGWLLYDWSQTQPRREGSTLFQSLWYAAFFDRLVIAADAKGAYHYALTIGDQIRTVLTPMTLAKPNFNGIRWDFLSDLYGLTILLSRINSPGYGMSYRGIPDQTTDNTQLFGGRGTVQLGDAVEIGATYVNAHQSQTLTDFGASPFEGMLSTAQNRDISLIQIRLSDDSPEDGKGGAALFDQEVWVTDVDGVAVRGKDVGLEPLIEGGKKRIGFLAADGNEHITLTYDLSSPSYTGPAPARIDHLRFRLLLANDYRVEVTSNRQTNRYDKPVFLTVARAEENVKDNTNQRIVAFDYGLPVANEVYGITVEVRSAAGFDLFGEFDVARGTRKYPNLNAKHHHRSTSKAHGGYVNVSYRRYPWYAFVEMFEIQAGYDTDSFLVGRDGTIDYEDPRGRYRFVDDNDDFDRFPDEHEATVFPGYDENNDFISDFNQNNNVYPDYEEPFLRYGVDRPEFLFGMDMNNNGWIDRFENDDLPDYPYKKDHRGYNVYGGVHLMPGVRAVVGQEREELLSQDGRNRTTYALLSLNRTYGRGRLRVCEYLRLAKDTIRDDVFQWVQTKGSRGSNRWREDPLFARNTWINTAFAEFEYRSGVEFITKVKGEMYSQRRPERNGRRRSGFVGIIHKAEYLRAIGGLTVLSRGKSEFLWDRPYSSARGERKEWRATLSCVLRSGFSGWRKGRVFKKTALEVGAEASFLRSFRDGSGNDGREIAGLAQLTHWTTYLGYRMVSQAGFRMTRQEYADRPTRIAWTSFATVIAGIQE